MKELAQRCVRGISDGEVMAVGNDKMRVKLSPSSFQREGGQSLIQGLRNGQDGQNSIWRGKEVSRGRVCGKGLLVWQNITELLIHSSFLTSWSTLKKSVLEWISQWALEAKCFPYRRKSLRGKANKRRILPVRHCTSFFPFTAVSEVSTNPLFFFWE